MSFACGPHGWRHAQRPCPSCAAEQVQILTTGSASDFGQLVAQDVATYRRANPDVGMHEAHRQVLAKKSAMYVNQLQEENMTLRRVVQKLSTVLKLARNAFCDRECDGRGHSLNCRTLRATLLATRD